ncbi:unnamed protein product, partial [Bodo saltans]
MTPPFRILSREDALGMSQPDDESDFVADDSDFALRTYLETLLDRGVLNDRTLTIAAKLRAVLLWLHECARPRETHPVRKGYQSLCNDFCMISGISIQKGQLRKYVRDRQRLAKVLEQGYMRSPGAGRKS